VLIKADRFPTLRCGSSSAGDGPSESASDNTAWSAVYGNGTDVLFPVGESTYNAYLISDSVQNVAARMDDLFRLGAR